MSAEHGKPLPWATVSAAIDSALRGRLLERTPDSGHWPCGWPEAADVRLRVPVGPPPPPPPTPQRPYAEAELQPSELQDLVDGLPDILKAGAGLDLRFKVRLDVGQDIKPDDQRLLELNEAIGKAVGKLRISSQT